MCNNMCNINLLGVFLSSLTYFALGALWYSPLLFSKTWRQESKTVPDKSKFILGTIISTYFITLFMVFVLAALISGLNATSLIAGLMTGSICAIGFIAAPIAIGYLYERRSIKLFLINAGYHFSGLTISGIILGGLR